MHNGELSFNRQYAMSIISSTDPLMLFGTITDVGQDNELLIKAMDDLVQVLAETDFHALTGGFERLIHFYEMFLTYYDPGLRDSRGVYYTPQSVVSYIVRSVDLLLRSRFGCQDGLADASTIPYIRTDKYGKTMLEHRPRVVTLDPACGSGAFLHGVIDHVREMYRRTGNNSLWYEYARDHLLPSLSGFELLLTPYLIAHLNLGMQLAGLDLSESERSPWAYDLKDGKRLGIYLINTLGEIFQRDEETPGRAILDVSNKASQGTQEYPVMVVLGNPPYAGHSLNKGTWITRLIEAYKDGCPELKKPAQAKWLSDDYVKFMRFAQWHIERAGYGILAFVTNHSYLDNPTFRGMRYSLMQSFDEIYILDLHGNSKKKEGAPDGLKDENVFDIQQGTAIDIFVKWREVKDHHPATVRHADLWGLRELYESDEQGKPMLTGGKYAWLAQHDIDNTSWRTLNPQAPLYLFAPQDTQHLAEYEAGWKVPDIFRPNGDPAPGIVTTHDEFAISWSKAEAMSKIERLLATNNEDEARQMFRLCTQDQWQYASAKKELVDSQWRQEMVEVLYRPFDKRWTVFNRHVAVHRRERVMRHMLAGKNLGITIGRAGQVINSEQWDIVFCTRNITEYNLYRRGGNNLFPLYLYPDAWNITGRSASVRENINVPGNRQINLASEFISDFSTKLGMRWMPGRFDESDGCDEQGERQQAFGPEDVLAYMYAIFYSPNYRKRYAAFLKVDFPRLPLTSNAILFRALCNLGNKLIGLHLMEEQVPLITCYPVCGDNRVEMMRYFEPTCDHPISGQVWINKTQYFENVPSEAWAFHIGGYQVCQKWLKARKGRTLSWDEVMHYQRIVAVLAETSWVMREIDEVIERYGGWPIDKE